MHRISSCLVAFRVLSRMSLFCAALAMPAIAMQSVQAGSQTMIEDSRAFSSGAGLVLLVSLQRH